MSAKRKAAPDGTTLRVVRPRSESTRTALRGGVTSQNFHFHPSIPCEIRVEEKKTGTVMDYHIYIDEPRINADLLKERLGEIGRDLGFSNDLVQGMQNVVEKAKQKEIARRMKNVSSNTP